MIAHKQQFLQRRCSWFFSQMNELVVHLRDLFERTGAELLLDLFPPLKHGDDFVEQPKSDITCGMRPEAPML